MSYRWQSICRLSRRRNQRGEEDPEKQDTPQDIWRMGAWAEWHRSKTYPLCLRREVSPPAGFAVIYVGIGAEKWFVWLFICHTLVSETFRLNHLCSWADLFYLFDRVTVTFNVNNSIPPNLEEEPEQGQKAEGNEVEHALNSSHISGSNRLFIHLDWSYCIYCRLCECRANGACGNYWALL